MFAVLRATMPVSDFYMPFIFGFGSSFPSRPPYDSGGNMQTSQVPVLCFCACRFSDPAEPLSASPYRLKSLAWSYPGLVDI